MPSCSTASAPSAHAGGVHDLQMGGANERVLAHEVAGGAGDRRDNRAVVADQGVEDTGFADVRRAGHHHQQSVAKSSRLRLALSQPVQLRVKIAERGRGTGAVDEVIALVGKVHRRLEPQMQVTERRR